MPIYGYGHGPEPGGHRNSKTPSKVRHMGRGFWSTPISKLTFPKNLRWTNLRGQIAKKPIFGSKIGLFWRFFEDLGEIIFVPCHQNLVFCQV